MPVVRWNKERGCPRIKLKYVNLFAIFGEEGIDQYAVLLVTIIINIILTVLATVVDISLEFY